MCAASAKMQLAENEGVIGFLGFSWEFFGGHNFRKFRIQRIVEIFRFLKIFSTKTYLF